MTLIKLDNEVQYLKSVVGGGRDTFLVKQLEAGIYLLMIEMFWKTEDTRDFNVTTYSA